MIEYGWHSVADCLPPLDVEVLVVIAGCVSRAVLIEDDDTRYGCSWLVYPRGDVMHSAVKGWCAIPPVPKELSE